MKLYKELVDDGEFDKMRIRDIYIYMVIEATAIVSRLINVPPLAF